MKPEDPNARGESQGPAISAREFTFLVEMVGAEMPDVLIDLLDTYLDESAGLIGVLQSAKADGREAEMLRPAHSLKSSSASVGAMRLSALCAALEEYLRQGGGPFDAAAQVDKIAAEFERVRQELETQKSQLRSR
jgi:HPt (histidine-containing phosphotransfer) domain-containing protein